MRRLLRRIAQAHAVQVDMWERYFALQRPWEPRLEPLRWSHTVRGWRLRGTVLPQVRPQDEPTLH